jgi:hypothetical protein
MNLNQRDIYTITFTVAENRAGAQAVVNKITAMTKEIIAYEILGPFSMKLEHRQISK